MINFNKLVVIKKRKKHSSGFKTKIILEALQERESIPDLGKKYELQPTQVSNWKKQFLSNANEIFEKGVDKGDDKGDDEKEKSALFKKVGQLQMEVDFQKKSWAIAMLLLLEI